MSTKPRASKSPSAQAPGKTSLADALFTATQQRVLALLFGQPDRTFFTNELIGMAGSGSGAVQREIRRLVESGLVTASRIGNQKHYQANHTAPIYEELRSIVTKTFGVAEVVRSALGPLTARMALALIYGSVARGSDTAKSDVDLLVVSDELTLEEVYAVLAPAERQLGRPVNPTLYTPAEFEQRITSGNPFLKRVLSGEVMVLTGTLPHE